MSCNLNNISRDYHFLNAKKQDNNYDKEIMARQNIIAASEEIIKITKEQITDLNKIIDLTEQLIVGNEKIMEINNLMITNNEKKRVVLEEICGYLEALIKLKELNKASSKISLETIIPASVKCNSEEKTKLEIDSSDDSYEKMKLEIYGAEDYERMKLGIYGSGYRAYNTLASHSRSGTLEEKNQTQPFLYFNSYYNSLKHYFRFF